MIRPRGSKWQALPYLNGRKVYIGTFDTEAEAQKAHDRAVAEQAQSDETWGGFAERWPKDYPRNKQSTNGTNAERVRGFIEDFGAMRMGLPLSGSKWAKANGVRGNDRVVARAWALKNRAAHSSVRAMFNDARNDGLIGANPFEKLRLPQSRGRKDLVPPTAADLEKLTNAARDVCGDYGDRFAAQIIFAAYTGIRPGELFELRWSDLDFRNLKLRIARRVYRGEVDEPKTGRRPDRLLPPPARDAALSVPRPTDPDALVFTARRGGPLTASGHYYYWNPVRAAAGFSGMDFYDLRHYCATYLLNKGINADDVAHQLGHRDGSLVRSTYGHPDEDLTRRRILAAFEEPTPLRAVPNSVPERQQTA